MSFLQTIFNKIAAQLIAPLRPLAIIILGGYTLLWGVWVGNPAWDALGGRVVFNVMTGLFPEWVWGILGVVIGLGLLMGLILKSYHILVVFSTLSGWFWGIITLLLFFGDWTSVLGFTAAVFAIHAIFIYLNIKVNREVVGLSERKP